MLPQCFACDVSSKLNTCVLCCRSGDNAPAFALGQLKVMRGRFMVNYRLVNAIYIMVVTEPAANVFLCVQVGLAGGAGRGGVLD